ncbi:MAG TPA: hypothetical protein VMI56_18030 [Reyranella sp.]|nr:hypothetical protein [Reyranella sp.]
MHPQSPTARLVREELDALRLLAKTRRVRSLQLYLERAVKDLSPFKQPDDRPKAIAAE